MDDSIRDKAVSEGCQIPTIETADLSTGLPKNVALSIRAHISGFRTSASGGYRLNVDIPEIESSEAKNLLDFNGKNVQLALVILPG